MYLVDIDPTDGLVKITGLHDGVMTIKEFRDVINEPGLGREALTAIALHVDWMSKIRYYSTKDRPKKAMYDVTGNRNAFVWDQELIQRACVKYMELQPNPDLLEKEKLDDMLIKKLQEIENEKDDVEVLRLFKQLNIIKDLREKWVKDNQSKDLYADAPTVNGYTLSRLEEKLLDKRSFYHNQ